MGGEYLDRSCSWRCGRGLRRTPLSSPPVRGRRPRPARRSLDNARWSQRLRAERDGPDPQFCPVQRSPARERRSPRQHRPLLPGDRSRALQPGRRAAKVTADLLHDLRNAEALPGQKVVIPGEPEAASRVEREANGIRVPESLITKIVEICAANSVPNLLEEVPSNKTIRSGPLTQSVGPRF